MNDEERKAQVKRLADEIRTSLGGLADALGTSPETAAEVLLKRWERTRQGEMPEWKGMFSHDNVTWQSHYAGPNQGQQYRCIICGAGGASSSSGIKQLTYNCHECTGQSTMWPTPQYALYRQQFLLAEHLGKALKTIADGMENEPVVYAGLVLAGTL